MYYLHLKWDGCGCWEVELTAMAAGKWEKRAMTFGDVDLMGVTVWKWK